MVITGDNNQGKTNFLEAIYFSAKLTSPRESEASVLIQLGHNEAQLGVDFVANDATVNRVYLTLDRENPVKIQLNEQLVKSIAGYRRQFNVEFINADVIRIFTESPEFRRRDLGQFIAQIDPAYGDEVTRYQRVMRQRNQALQHGSSEKTLAIWNQQLATLAGEIVEKRLAAIQKLEVSMNGLAQRLFPDYLPIEIHYRIHGFMLTEFSKSAYIDLLMAGLAARYAREREQGVTTLGPHRDDISLHANSRELTAYYSRGINRAMAFVWKLAQIELIWDAGTGTLLLDEPFAEIDDHFRERISHLINPDYQVILATIDRSNTRYFDSPQVLSVTAGRVI